MRALALKTVRLADDVLLLGFESVLEVVTVPVLRKPPTVVVVTVTVIVADLPSAIVPRWQVIAAPPVQLPCVVLTDANVRPVGSGSTTVTSVASSGPLFSTTSVNVPRLPTATRGVEVALTIWTSEMRGAASVMLVWALAWLLFGFESFVDVTSALLTAARPPPAAGR